MAIKNLEVLVGQLEKQLVDHLSSSFGANTAQNLYNESLGWEVLETCPVFKT